MTLAITVTGKVQGVFFRASTREKARTLGLSGFVKNQTDGSVYIEASGGADQLKDLIAWCKQGPQFANVESVDVSEMPNKEYPSFEIGR
jgi:acylphosphatase